MRRQKAQYFTLRQYQADFYELVEKWDQVDANSQGLFFEQFENAVNVLMGNVPGSVNLTFSPVITSDGVR
ncbi:MAG: hypothetical protein H6767_03340 [Candidatus Peribacteria bacterium]|nr:MAG: hypothetical protein H6767_03340 [Candidatus Peribacteria bacterium]